MENQQFPSKNKFISIHEEKFIREVNYDYFVQTYPCLPKNQLLDLEILQGSPSRQKSSQTVLLYTSCPKRSASCIKTLYIADDSRFHSKKGPNKSRSRLAIGDHPSFTTYFNEGDSCSRIPRIITRRSKKEIAVQVEDSSTDSINFPSDSFTYKYKLCNENDKKFSDPRVIINHSKINPIINHQQIDITNQPTYLPTVYPEDCSPSLLKVLNKIVQRINHLEHKILKQAMVLRFLDLYPSSSSEKESNESIMKSSSESGRPGCSYVGQYSHVPGTSAFQRLGQQTAQLSTSTGTTIDREHNSEQYGRDFTTYDGITARDRRQGTSVPCKRNKAPATDRTFKIRHKLNPVRDYRLMDTVHYLAQGEFAPRDDGIKLTPSREAVLSDIIWEDVCRTHWPSARLGRRVVHPDRCNTRCELQRLIDSMLRERVAHMERRRRRHYRVVKLNNRHECCKPFGKTGDIIVASHKKKERVGKRNVVGSEESTMVFDRRWPDHNLRRSHRSHDPLVTQESRFKRQCMQDDTCPGPSYTSPHRNGNREPTCCYQSSSHVKPNKTPQCTCHIASNSLKLASSSTTEKSEGSSPRKFSKTNQTREEPNLDHYILLPTLVVKTPSNVKRQKKFNELYHRILNVQYNNGTEQGLEEEVTDRRPMETPSKRDIGLNIDITSSNTKEDMQNQ